MQNLKCVVIGDGAVGKTCMLMSYTIDNFPKEHIPTVFDNYATNIMVDGKNVNMSLWDTAGQEDFDRLRLMSYPETDVLLVCFSVSSKTSLMNVQSKWVPELRKNAPGAPFILVGTKADTRSSCDNAVSAAEAQKLCDDLKGYKYMECSALTREGLREVFDEAARCAFKSREATKPRRKRCIIM